MKRLLIVLIVSVMLLAACDSKTPSATLSENNSAAPLPNAPENTLVAAPSESPQNNSSHASISAPEGDMVVIKEKMFIAQTNDIYYNPEDYLGKTIKYEGVFCAYEWPDNGVEYYSVIRYGPGCCGNDANAGFEVVWDKAYPEQNDWVEVVGVLEAFEEDGYQSLRLSLSSLTVLPTRGEEYVSQ